MTFLRARLAVSTAMLALLAVAAPASAQLDVGGTVGGTVGGSVGGVGGTVGGVVGGATGTVGGLLPGAGQPGVEPEPEVPVAPSAGSGPGATAGVADSVAPIVRVIFPSRVKLSTVLRRGVPLKVRCNEACVFASALVLDGRTAKKLGLSRGAPAVAGQSWGFVTLPTGTATRLELTGRYKRALRKASRARGFRSLKLTVVSRGSDAADNKGGLVARSITLTR